jgi:hypothetical protein
MLSLCNGHKERVYTYYRCSSYFSSRDVAERGRTPSEVTSIFDTLLLHSNTL